MHKITESDMFIICASDGVWEFLSNEEVTNMVSSFEKRKVNIAAAIVEEKAFNTWLVRENNRTDDIACLVYYL